MTESLKTYFRDLIIFTQSVVLKIFIGTTPQNIIFRSAFLTVVDPPDPGIVRHTTPAHTKLIVIVVCVSALAMFLVVVIFFTY